MELFAQNWTNQANSCSAPNIKPFEEVLMLSVNYTDRNIQHPPSIVCIVSIAQRFLSLLSLSCVVWLNGVVSQRYTNTDISTILFILWYRLKNDAYLRHQNNINSWLCYSYHLSAHTYTHTHPNTRINVTTALIRTRRWHFTHSRVDSQMRTRAAETRLAFSRDSMRFESKTAKYWCAGAPIAPSYLRKTARPAVTYTHIRTTHHTNRARTLTRLVMASIVLVAGCARSLCFDLLYYLLHICTNWK